MTQGRSAFATRLPVLLVLVAILIGAPGVAFALHSVEPHHRLTRIHHPIKRLRRLLWNPLFRPSHDSLIRQNEEIDRLDLPRIQDDAELEALKASAALVPIEDSEL